MNCFALLVGLFYLCLQVQALPPIYYAVNATVVVKENPPSIELNWEKETCTTKRTCTGFAILKNVYNSSSLVPDQPTLLVSLNGTTKKYVDTDVSVGVVYEYTVLLSFSHFHHFVHFLLMLILKVRRTSTGQSPATSFTHFLAGIKV